MIERVIASSDKPACPIREADGSAPLDHSCCHKLLDARRERDEWAANAVAAVAERDHATRAMQSACADAANEMARAGDVERQLADANKALLSFADIHDANWGTEGREECPEAFRWRWDAIAAARAAEVEHD